MDYKELIEWLRHTVEHGDKEPREYCTNMCGGCEMCDQAATAIETLLAERDALIEELRGICWCCAHGRKWENAPGWSKMTTCEHLKEIGVLAHSGGKTKCPHWEWRGAKGGAIDAVAELHDQG